MSKFFINASGYHNCHHDHIKIGEIIPSSFLQTHHFQESHALAIEKY